MSAMTIVMGWVSRKPHNPYARHRPRSGHVRPPGGTDPAPAGIIAAMRCLTLVAILGLAGLLPACTPTFNWREITVGGSSVTLMMPCKPEAVTRQLTLGSDAIALTLRSCSTGGSTFAFGHAQLSGAEQTPRVLVGWRDALRASVQADAAVSTELPAGLASLPQAIWLGTSGPGSKGQPLAIQGLWFARGDEIFAVLLYAESIAPDVAGTFFSGLRLQ